MKELLIQRIEKCVTKYMRNKISNNDAGKKRTKRKTGKRKNEKVKSNCAKESRKKLENKNMSVLVEKRGKGPL